jgi:hypothetical protein
MVESKRGKVALTQGTRLCNSFDGEGPVTIDRASWGRWDSMRFWEDPRTPGQFPADAEWVRLWATHPNELVDVFVYLGDVDRGGPAGQNIPLSQSPNIGAGNPVDLYQRVFGNLVVFFTFNGTISEIVLLATVADPRSIPYQLQQLAEGRRS